MVHCAFGLMHPTPLHIMAMARNPDTDHMARACHAMRKACELGECRPLEEFEECKAD
jgi:hypothetical protein